jgi:beta-glucosidase-like glycosyl hydrolase
MRNPKAGRAWEAFGPDPYLNGEASYETIVGVQSTGVQACVKHFLANNQEHWRYGSSSNLDDRTMHEIYFYPFLRSIEVRSNLVSAFPVSYSLLHKGECRVRHVCLQPVQRHFFLP